MYHRFIDREDAALKLIPLLNKYRNDRGIVLAVPRGGVPIAYHVAKRYNLPLELLMTKKIGHPSNPEYAIGAVSLEDHIIDESLGIPQSYIDNKIEEIRKSLQDRYKKFMGNHKPIGIENKVVIIIDDGMATGNTILSSIKMLRHQNPKKIVVAVPVATSQAVAKIRKQVDELICLYIPEPFYGVGLHYMNFNQVEDEEVIRLLKEINHVDNVA
jgi:putative phosphoribosyl transferase